LLNGRREHRNEIVLRLASLPKRDIEDFLLRRGLDPASIDDVKAALAAVGTPITPQEAVNYSFTAHGAPPTFGTGRFGDGTVPVYYAALEMKTCEREVKYHLAKEIAVVPLPRLYQLIACDFAGDILDVCGHEHDHPELVSETDSGYPFCQALAQRAIASNIDAFHTPSARRLGGICTPVFSHPALTSPRFADAAQVIIRD
jgi:hypothetical protein